MGCLSANSIFALGIICHRSSVNSNLFELVNYGKSLRFQQETIIQVPSVFRLAITPIS